MTVAIQGLALHEFSRHTEALNDRLASMLWYRYKKQSPLQIAFCALMLTLEPNCKIRRLYDALPYRTLRVNMVEFKNTMAHLGYGSHQLETLAPQIDQRLLPCLFVTESDTFEWPNQPLVILKIDEAKKRLTIYDCVKEKARYATFDEAETWGFGEVCTFFALQEDQQTTSKFMRAGTGFTWFRALLSRFNKIFYQVLFAGFFLNLIALTVPIFIMLVYDRVIATQSTETLWYLVPFVVLAICFEWGLRYLRSQNLSWLAARLDSIVGNRVFSHLIQLEPKYIEQASISSQISRVRSFEHVRDFFSGPVFLSMLELPFTILALVIIALIAGPLVWVPIVLAGVYLGLFFVMRRYIRVLIRTAAKASSARQLFSIETLEKIEDIRAYGLEEAWQDKFRQLAGREYLAHFKLNQYGVTAETLGHALTIISAVAVLSFGTGLIWSGDMTVGALVATMILVWRVLTPLYSLCTMIPRLEQLSGSIAQVNDLMDIENEAQQNVKRARLKKLNGSLSFNEVTLQYTEEQAPVFTHLNLEVAAGEVAVISAPSGCGKSSILKLAQGLYQPTKGAIRVDGFDIRQIDPVDLRRQIAYLPQKPDFFFGTVMENMQLAKPTAKEPEVWQALRMAGAASAVESMPEKLETLIAKPGTPELTPVLKFQLSLARLYLQNAKMVLIDEQPDAVLQGETGKQLKAYIQQSKGQRCIVMASPRRDFIALADQVLLLHLRKQPTQAKPQELEQLQEVPHAEKAE